MELINNFFSFRSIYQIGAIVFSFLFVILTVQMSANISAVVKTVRTKRNSGFVLLTLIMVIISILLFILGFVIL